MGKCWPYKAKSSTGPIWGIGLPSLVHWSPQIT